MANSGHDILVYDNNENKIKVFNSFDRDTIESCLFEVGLGDTIVRNKERIKFTSKYSDTEKFLDEADAVFMCLPTPEKEGGNGETDMSFYFNASEELAKHLVKRNDGKQDKYVVITNKSTVPIGTAKKIEEFFKKNGVINFGIVSNPEFLVEGKAMECALKPFRIVVGAWNDMDFEVMRKIYRRFYDSPTSRYIEVNPPEAEVGKLLANYMLFSRLGATMGVVGRVCEIYGGMKFENLREILSADERIGTYGFYNTLYVGGSCLIKDAFSLAHQIEKEGADACAVRQLLDTNLFQRDHFYSRAEKEANFSFKGKVVSLLGVAFKRETNDVRHSGAVDIAKHLIDDGAKSVRVYDPAAMPMFRAVFDPKKDERFAVFQYFNDTEESLHGSDVCFILTDWPQFRSLGERIKKICKPPYLIMDGRRMIQHQYDELVKDGYNIIAVGSPYLTT